ncbi:acyltransferase, partial [Escherichia coli]|nr:acyltransferase [Escherichia coli]
IRLHPMVVFGSLLGLITLCANPLRGDALAYGPGSLGILLLTSIFLIPYPAMPEAGFSLFGLNSPAWSLFSEYMANLAYALVLCRLGRR